MTRKTTNTPNSTPKARLSDAPVGSLVPMPNGGALRNGGTNRGGSGRPPEWVRARSRAMYESVLDEFEARDLSLATLGELALIGNTAARYGGLAAAPDEPDAGPITITVVRRPVPLPEARLVAPLTPTDAWE